MASGQEQEGGGRSETKEHGARSQRASESNGWTGHSEAQYSFIQTVVELPGLGPSGQWATFARSVFVVAVPPARPVDPTRILLSSTVEVNYWCHTLNCTETRLRNAVLAVGPLVADVRAYLAR